MKSFLNVYFTLCHHCLVWVTVAAALFLSAASHLCEHGQNESGISHRRETATEDSTVMRGKRCTDPSQHDRQTRFGRGFSSSTHWFSTKTSCINKIIHISSNDMIGNKKDHLSCLWNPTRVVQHNIREVLDNLLKISILPVLQPVYYSLYLKTTFQHVSGRTAIWP